MVDEFFVVESQGRQLGRQGEDHMDVRAGEQFAPPCLQPAFSCPGLTLGAVPIAAAVVGDGGTMSTAATFIDMSAEGGGATARNGQQDFAVSPADPVAAALEESGSGRADQVGHLQGRPSHLDLRL